jgi:hypothetical protein
VRRAADFERADARFEPYHVGDYANTNPGKG